MTRGALAIFSILAVAAMTAAGLWAAAGLPADTLLPVHWNLSGEADRFADKWTALMLMPAVAAGTSLLFHFLPALEPRARSLRRSEGLYLACWAGMLLLFLLVQAAMIGVAMGRAVPVAQTVMAGTGCLFLLIGNQLGKSRRMYMVGIRTPWTLASEEVWIRTHRLGGRLMALFGAILLAAALLGVPSSALAVVLIVGLAGAVIVPVGYSWWLWRREKADQPSA